MTCVKKRVTVLTGHIRAMKLGVPRSRRHTIRLFPVPCSMMNYGMTLMRVLIVFTPIVLVLIGTPPARAAQPTLTLNGQEESREYTAAALLARPDTVSLSVPYDTVYGNPMSYRAVPLLALLGEIPQGRFDTLEA